MARLKITQNRSVIGTKQNHRDTLRTLGLKRVNDVAVREDSAVVRGQVHSVRHLVTVEEVD
ncbi:MULTISPECIES: 50S ribosomal protein L30 [Streptomyces]|uniref:Large ribosomal subunit protein uL30 n=1 Tax=Streptomyces cacaoi TaxID=1898 RepID=A0A4Y3QTL5_STRCI|nr:MULTISPECIES: 50S ribosomal protein L30 [Streptomyces]NNG84378.1 50S ribosomal protein L30 [Streptomyces cacaoi]QHF97520.1 50S ribosomal protein L30 [Streptomyces sp. NHF165]GEB48754.1 50S ribosomal protein L30 [Streptomyces cacaoi]